MGAFNFSAISRLKLTWKALPEKYQDLAAEMDDLCCVEKHYIPYKKLLLKQQPPLIPYLGVFLRDLTFIEVGNPTYRDKMINFDKFRMLAAILEDIRCYQQVPYKFEQNQALQMVFRQSLLTLDADELFNLSRIVEPPPISTSKTKRNSTSKIIIRSLKKTIS